MRLVAWEVTRSCNLACVHCRASARAEPYEGELSTAEALALLSEFRKLGEPIVILTGGEPLLRADVFDLAARGNALGLRMTLATNGTLVTPGVAARMKESGIRRVSISLDGATAASHDAFRRVAGAFEGALGGIARLREAGVEFQVNTTVTRENLREVAAIQELAVRLGAVAHHIFLLVPTGRGREMETVAAREYEETLHWFYDQRGKVPLQLKATCAPHYHRILRERAKVEGVTVDFPTFGLDAVTRGCLGGSGFCFVSHVGKVQPCGYLEVDCGDVRGRPFSEIWESSPVFVALRDVSRYEGKCGRCEYLRVCGGCRARAFEATGNYLAEEPLCLYEPRRGCGT